MKTRNEFNVGDIVRHNDKLGMVTKKEGKHTFALVTIEWRDGGVSVGQHCKMWALDKVDPPELSKDNVW